jgi:hypothetical protein
MENRDDLAGDLMEGVPAISRFLGVPERRVYWLAANKTIPLFKQGNVWCGRKSTLRRHYDRMEQATVDQGAA